MAAVAASAAGVAGLTVIRGGFWMLDGYWLYADIASRFGMAYPIRKDTAIGADLDKLTGCAYHHTQ